MVRGLHTSPVPSGLNLIALPSASKHHSSSPERIEQSDSFMSRIDIVVKSASR
jgi:hypothetical protein